MPRGSCIRLHMCLCRQAGAMLPAAMLRPGSELLAMMPSVLHAVLTQHPPLLGVSWLTPAQCMGCMGWLAARPRGMLLISTAALHTSARGTISADTRCLRMVNARCRASYRNCCTTTLQRPG